MTLVASRARSLNGGGGGIFNWNGPLLLNGSVLSSNTINGSGEFAGLGGGLMNYGGTVRMTDVQLSGNRAQTTGGALYNFLNVAPPYLGSTGNGEAQLLNCDV